jgi:hypothetical protein
MTTLAELACVPSGPAAGFYRTCVSRDRSREMSGTADVSACLVIGDQCYTGFAAEISKINRSTFATISS